MTTVVYDMDGVLVDVSHLHQYVTGTNEDFEKFHELAIFAPPKWEHLFRFVRHQLQGDRVIIVTARCQKYQVETYQWLKIQGISPDALFMRKVGDYRSDAEVKSDALDAVEVEFGRVLIAYDDNPHVIKMMKDRGIPAPIEIPGWIPYD